MRRRLRAALPLALAALALARGAGALEVRVPLLLGPGFLRRLAEAQLFTDPDGTLRLAGEGRCSEAVLRAPAVSASPGRVRIEPEGRGHAGFALAGRCLRLLSFEGSLAVDEEVYLDPAAPVVRFRVLGSELRPRGVAWLPVERLWGWIRPAVHPRLEALRVDLGPALEEVRRVLPLFARRGHAEAAARMAASLALREVRADARGVTAVVRFEVDASGPPPPARPEAPLSADEVAALERTARDLDAFATFVVKQAGRDAFAPELRGELLEVLLDARHEVVRLLAEPGGDPDAALRRLFLDTWSRLAPLLRRTQGGLPAEGALHYLSFVAAGDVLAALDAAAPAFGLELSADGLRRLARTLSPAARDPLARDPAVDPELREIFGFGPLLAPPAPRAPEPPEPTPEGVEAPEGAAPPGEGAPDEGAPAPGSGASSRLERLARGLLALVATPASAEPAPAESLAALAARLNRWAPGPADFRDYLPLAARLLRGVAEGVGPGSGLERRHEALLPALLLATGWQESCWRQYVRRGARLVPLRSAGGDVGLMQVNESVWRGFYDLEGLRWDVAYNARAGAEILLHYLRDFAVARREERRGGLEALARSTWAMYNGGPGQLGRWRDPKSPASVRAADAAFLQKYKAMRAGDVAQVESCYTG